MPEPQGFDRGLTNYGDLDVRTTVEPVRSRFGDRRVVGGPSFAADNAGFEALARSQSMVLPQGSVISTGTATKPFNIAGAVAVKVRYLDATLTFHTEIR